MLVSDAAQRTVWPTIKKNLKPGDALYFSHGFSIVYKDQTGVIPPKDVDVIMVAPKGSGTSVRRNFLSGAGHQLQLRRLPGRDRPRRGTLPGRRHRHRLRLPVPDDVREGSLQRPDRRARRAHGRAGRHHGGPVRRAPQARPQPERSVQRDRRGADPEPDPARGRERHGLDVLELLGHRPARRAQVEADFPQGRTCRCSRSSTSRSRPARKRAKSSATAAARTTRSSLAKKLAEIHDSEMWQAGAAVRALRPGESQGSGRQGRQGRSERALRGSSEL